MKAKLARILAMAIGAEENRNGHATAAAGPSGTDTLASLCNSQANGFTELPVERIEEIVKPTGPPDCAGPTQTGVSEGRR